MMYFFFFQAEDGIRDGTVTGVQTCALPISSVQQVVLGAPVSAVNVHHDGKPTLFFFLRQAEIAKLVGVRAISQALVGWRRSKRQDVVGHAGFPDKRIEDANRPSTSLRTDSGRKGFAKSAKHAV